jgi:hypothetical protein
VCPLYSDIHTLPSLAPDFSVDELNSSGWTNFICRVKEPFRVHDDDELISGLYGVYYCNVVYLQ